jgi:HAD superfamily hydrolase (TIGR01509 family)
MPRPAILSDIGNVLVTFDFSIATRRCAQKCPYPEEQLMPRLAGIKEPYENGEMDDATFLGLAREALCYQGSEADLAELWCDIFAENAAMRTTLDRFAGRLPMYLLSNTNGLHKDFLLRHFSIFDLFLGGVFSYSARCSKPDAAIFLHSIERLDLEPEKTFFIDDLEPNIVMAQSLGFHTHHYRLDDHPACEHALQLWLASQQLG